MLGNIATTLKNNPTNREHAGHLATPSKEYTIFFTARSGSTYLTDLLESVRLGDPREWLNPGFVKDQAHYFGSGNFRDYFLRMRSDFSPGGIFGHEMTLWFYQYFSKEVRLEDYFNLAGPSVFLFRENIVEQAVSLFLAVGRGVFHRTSETGDLALPEVPYDAAEIERYVKMFADEENAWGAMFERQGWTPRYLSYERMTTQSPAAVAEAFGRLLDSPVDVSVIRLGQQKVGNSVNRDYAERFERENVDVCRRLARERRWLGDMLETDGLLGRV